HHCSNARSSLSVSSLVVLFEPGLRTGLFFDRDRKRPPRGSGLVADRDRLDPRVLSLAAKPVGDLAIGHLARDAIALLDAADQLLALAFSAVEVIVGQLAPLFADAPLEFLPVAFDSIPVHCWLLCPVRVARHHAAEYGRARRGPGLPAQLYRQGLCRAGRCAKLAPRMSGRAWC